MPNPFANMLPAGKGGGRGGEQAGRNSFFRQQQQQEPEQWWQREDAGSILPGSPSPFDPSGRYGSPVSGMTSKNLLPHAFVGPLVNSPEAKDYANVGQSVTAQGVQATRGGEQAAIKESAQTSASQGLGRGFQAQQESDIRQQGTMNATSAIMAGRLEEVARNFELEALFASSLIESNKARFSSYLQRKAISAGESSASSSLFGGVIGAVGSIVGGAIA